MQGPKSTGKKGKRNTWSLVGIITCHGYANSLMYCFTLHLRLQYSSWNFLLLFLLIHLEGKTLCPHELKSPAAQAQSSTTLKAQQRARCMPTSSHPFQAFPFWFMKGTCELPRNILKCEHEEVTEGFRRGRKPDRQTPLQ